MNQAPRLHSLTQCYHEAGHAVAFWHHGVQLLCVTMKPPAGSGHWGQTVPVEREITSLTQMEAEMQCAAAGEIAENWFLPTRTELRDDSLIRCFTRDAATVAEDPDFRINDGRNFAKIGLARDDEIRSTDRGADTGPASWLPVFREAEQLIRVELWPAVQAVAEELSRSPHDLSNDDVAALASAAMRRTQT